MMSRKIASIMSSKSVNSRTQWRQRLSSIPVIAVLLVAHHSFAAVPAIVSDAQQTLGNNLSNQQGIAVAPNGTIYVADTSNNRVVQIIPNLPGTSTQTTVTTPSLTFPQGIAVDAAGDLYISDIPGFGFTARVIELVANSSGAITSSSAVKTIYSGGGIIDPVALAVSSANTVFIADPFGGVYYIPAGGTLHPLTISGVSGSFTPTALALSGSNLFLANASSSGNGIYVVPATGGTAKPVLMGSFVIQPPDGLTVDASGDLFVLAQLASGSGAEQAIEIPNASAVNQSTPYIIPSSNVTNGTGIALDPQGDLEINGNAATFPYNGIVTQLNFLNPVYLGAVNVAQSGTAIVFNFEFNAPATFTGLRAITVGDTGTTGNDVVQASGRSIGICAAGTLTGLTAASPYSCYQQFQATPQFVGTRASSIQVKGSGSSILNSSPVYEVGQGAAQIAYPLDVVMTQLGLIQPQGITISGFDKTVYIADFLGDKVYSISGLNGSQASTVSTGSIALSAPSAVAMNGKGDLYIADFTLGEVIVVPTTTGAAPYVLNTGSLLQHPISLAVDALGDLYIGDAGSEGDAATSSNPGFVVEVPYTGSAFLLPTNGVSIIFPQALAFNNINGVLAIGDGGDENTAIGQVVEVTPAGAASVVSITNPAPTYDPSGLSFDAAGTLYVLDGDTNTVTEVYTNGSTALLPLSSTTALSAPSAMASSAGSQSFVIANLGGGTQNSLVYLNGNSVTLAFGNQTVNTVSAGQTVTVANIGNQTLTMSYPYYNAVSGFTLGSGSTCSYNESLTALTTCALAFDFAPTRAAAYNQTSGVNSNAYNSGTPAINLTGTGVAKVKANAVNSQVERRQTRFGRKSFALARGR